MNDADLDARFAALRDVEPSAALQRSTLEAVARARAEEAAAAPVVSTAAPSGTPNVVPFPRRRAAWAALAGGVALAAAVLLAVRPGPERGDPATMVPRGVGEAAPTLTLRVAVRTAQGLARLDPTRAYAPGDTLQFRVTASAPTEIALTRDGAPLWRGTVPAGDTDLPVGWSFEPGEGPAIFRIEGAGVAAEVRVPGVLP